MKKTRNNKTKYMLDDDKNVEILNEEDSKIVEDSIAEIESGNGKSFNSVEELIADLNKN